MLRAGLILEVLSPKHMPVLLDALGAHAERALKIVEPRYLLNEDWRAFARGDVDVASERLTTTARTFGTTPEEMAERFRAQAADESADFQGTKATYLGQMLASGCVADRHAYFCTEEMSALVRSAATDQVAESALSLADLPSTSGIAYLYDRAEPLVLRWASTSAGMVSANIAGHNGIRRILEDEFADPDTHVAQPFEQAQLSPPMSDDPPGAVAVIKPFGGDGQYSSIRPDNAIHTLFALSHLMRQAKLANAEVQAVRSPVTDRRGRRRARTDLITYLSYGAGEHRGRRDDASARNYSHRWVVRGHWRRQWYPSQNRHIPIWITEYVAGPADLPIEHRDKVRVAKPPALDDEGGDR
ncbi:hypothetical protein MycrhDRAFT_5617 [Mycolicibacterium rhodesiae JS60]|nr:hypothetical protein MycrhDRAFT_5617 [Mycolicibacterium rhodesiae JS60]